MIRRTLLVLALAAVATAAPASAEERVRAAPAAPPTATVGEVAPKVRASHRIDVIAPGERVDTVLSRARAAGAPTAAGAPHTRESSGTATLPVRGPEARPLQPPPPMDGLRPAGAAPPPGMAPGGPQGGPARGDGPPPDRPRSR